MCLQYKIKRVNANFYEFQPILFATFHRPRLYVTGIFYISKEIYAWVIFTWHEIPLFPKLQKNSINVLIKRNAWHCTVFETRWIWRWRFFCNFALLITEQDCASAKCCNMQCFDWTSQSSTHKFNSLIQSWVTYTAWIFTFFHCQF